MSPARVDVLSAIDRAIEATADWPGTAMGAACDGLRAARDEIVRCCPELAKLRRNRQLLAMYESGRTLAEIGNHFGLTAPRVRQILLRQGARLRSISEAQTGRRRNPAAVHP